MKRIFIFSSILAIGLLSCVGDLDVTPIDPDMETASNIYSTEEDFFSGLSKIYAGFAVTGQKGATGDADISGIDEGASQYWRGYFVCQELPTDEVINGWNDGTLPQMSQITWTASNEYVQAFYYRAIYQVTLANEFIRQAETYGQASFTKLPQYKAEARFLRALAYWHALDLFGNGIPFTTENSSVGSVLPDPAGVGPVGHELFDYIETELTSITADNGDEILPDPRTNYVGAGDKAAGWMLLAKLYLNHKTYLGTESSEYYEKGRTYINKLINEGGFSLADNYEYLFLADNYLMDQEIIFAIAQDGISMKNYGGSTYILNAAIGGDMVATDYGTSGGWGGNRVTKALVNKFESADARALWFTQGQSLEIDDQSEFTQGYACVKYKNLTQDGEAGSNADGGFADINIPVFRLADAYLMQCEFDLRIDGSLSTSAQTNLTELRSRANLTTDISSVDLSFILDERARELYWEGHRRTDLIRFGLFTSSEYVWPFKGNDVDGIEVDDHYNWMPIPYADLTANPNLIQNPEY